MRRVSLFFLCIGFVTISCDDGGHVGNCVNDSLLGEVGCQCVTPDKTYSRISKGYQDPELDDLHFCADKTKPYYLPLNDADIYICNSYHCATTACPGDKIPDADRRTCIKKAVCNANEAYNSLSNTCSCDKSANWEGEVGSCTCKSGYVEVSGQCVVSSESECDTTKEVYDATANKCKCDTSKNFDGEAGACTCATNYVLIGNTCEEKQTCRADQVYVEADNTCACPGANQVYDPDKDTCVCEKGTLWFGDACIAEAECTDSTKRMISQSDAGTCTCFDGYTYIVDDCYKAGETLTFGRYPQDEDSDIPSPLIWQILDIKEDSALLISKFVLEQYTYHDKQEDISWEKSNVRSYLNGLGAAFNKNGIDHYGKGFIDKAFTAEERKWIKQVTNKNPDAPADWNNTPGGNDTDDSVFLLSYEEVFKYFPTNKLRLASPTAYAIHPPDGSGRNNVWTCKVTCSGDNNCSCDSNGYGEEFVSLCSVDQCSSPWWLRSPGYSSNCAAGVVDGGGVSSHHVYDDDRGLRPALYIYLSSER